MYLMLKQPYNNFKIFSEDTFEKLYKAVSNDDDMRYLYFEDVKHENITEMFIDEYREDYNISSSSSLTEQDYEKIVLEYMVCYYGFVVYHNYSYELKKNPFYDLQVTLSVIYQIYEKEKDKLSQEIEYLIADFHGLIGNKVSCKEFEVEQEIYDDYDKICKHLQFVEQ